MATSLGDPTDERLNRVRAVRRLGRFRFIDGVRRRMGSARTELPRDELEQGPTLDTRLCGALVFAILEVRLTEPIQQAFRFNSQE